MAGRLTLWGAGELMRTFFGRTSEAPPFFYLALITDIAPTPYISGSELSEPTLEAGYTRLEIPNTEAMWISESGLLHLVSNELDLSFITAQADWGRISYWALCNAQESGYVYFTGDMEEELFVYAGDQAVVGAGELTIELGPFFTDEEF